MSREYKDVLSHAQALRKRGEDADQARAALLQSGWNTGAVDRALVAVGLADSRIQRMLRPRSLATAAFLIVAAGGLVVYSLRNDERIARQHDAAQAATGHVAAAQDPSTDVLAPERVVSADAGIQFGYPTGWLLSNLTSKDDVDAYAWQIEPPGNDGIRQQLEAEYGLSEIESLDAQFALLADPRVSQVVTVNIVVVKTPTYEVESSIEVWKQSTESIQEQSGLGSSGFTPVVAGSTPGYTYELSLDIGGSSITTQEYTYITPDSRIELSVFPAAAADMPEIAQVVQSLTTL